MLDLSLNIGMDVVLDMLHIFKRKIQIHDPVPLISLVR